MNTENKESKASTEVTAPHATESSLLAFDEFDSFFDDFLSRRWLWNFPPTVSEKGIPKVDILDYSDRIEVQAALPGVSKDALEVSINNQSITIHATTQEEKKEEEGKYFRQEIMRGEFQRTLSLPSNVDSDNATAVFKDGILKIAIPKTEKSKRKTLEIS